MAASEIVKAGQKGQTGAGLVFGAMGIAAVWEFFKNDAGIQLIQDKAQHFVQFGRSAIEILGRKIEYTGGMLLSTPEASPMVMGVGFIVGLRISAIALLRRGGRLAGARAAGHLPQPGSSAAIGAETGLSRPGDGCVVPTDPAARRRHHDRLRLLHPLHPARIADQRHPEGPSPAFKAGGASADVERTEQDLNLKWVLVAIGVMAIPMFLLYRYFSASTGGALVLTVVMLVLGVLFAAVAGYLVGLVGNSNNPISGLTLSALVISAVLMVLMGVTGVHGRGGGARGRRRGVLRRRVSPAT